jgi:hypothetical protein
MASICGSPVCAGGKPKLKFTYTGDYVVRKDGVVELLTSGTIVFLEPKVIDVFMVGGGSAGGGNPGGGQSVGRGGGAGGYTRTVRRMAVTPNTQYPVTIGTGGANYDVDGGSSAFNTFSVAGGEKVGSNTNGGNGGSGGGGAVMNNSDYGTGGSDGQNGEQGYWSGHTINGGNGQKTTTREFGEANGKLYAAGGGGGRYISAPTPVVSIGGAGGGGSGGWFGSSDYQAPAAGVANTGSGGGGGVTGTKNHSIDGASGGSGIVCFRDAAKLPELAGTWVLNERLYAPENDFDEITGYRFKVGTIECTRIRTANLTGLSAFRVFSGDTVDIYIFSTNTWKTTARTLTFPAGATASDEFRAWLASNATKQA